MDNGIDIAKVFYSGRSQAVRLPQKYRVDDDEMIISMRNDVITLIPKSKADEIFYRGLTGFSDDFFEDGRDQGLPDVREEL